MVGRGRAGGGTVEDGKALIWCEQEGADQKRVQDKVQPPAAINTRSWRDSKQTLDKECWMELPGRSNRWRPQNTHGYSEGTRVTGCCASVRRKHLLWRPLKAAAGKHSI